MGIDNPYLNQSQLHSMRHSSSTCLILNNWKGSFMSKQKVLFLCVYLTALVLMGITIQLYIKFYLTDINMNIPKISVLFTILILVILVLLILAYLIY